MWRRARSRLRLASAPPYRPAASAADARARRAAASTVYVVIALSGLTALAARSASGRAQLALVVRRDGVHLLADPRGVSGRARHRQQPRRALARQVARRGSRWAGARCCSCARDRVGRLPARRVAAVLADRSVDRPIRGSGPARSRRVRCRSSFPARCCGARVFRWRSPRPRRRAGSAGWSAACTRPTPSARSPARSAQPDPGRARREPARAAAARRAVGAVGRSSCSRRAVARSPRQRSRWPAAARSCRRGVAACSPGSVPRCPACSSRTAGTPRPGRTSRDRLCRRGPERLRRGVARRRAACRSITPPERCRHRARARTCGCSACWGTSRT